MSQEEFYVWYVFHVVHVDGLLEVLSLLLSIDIISTAGFYMAPFVHCRCSPAAPGGDPLSLSLSLFQLLSSVHRRTQKTHTQASWENIGCHGERGGSSTVEWCIHYSTCFLIHTHTHTHTHTHAEIQRCEGSFQLRLLRIYSSFPKKTALKFRICNIFPPLK
jgi:hypothetical protein